MKKNTKAVAALLSAGLMAGMLSIPAAAEDDLKVIRVLGVDNSGTDDTGTQVYLSDWVNGDSRMWQQLCDDLAAYGVKLELDLIPSDQYDTVLQTQIAAGLDYDFVNITNLDDKTRSDLIRRGTLTALNPVWENYSLPETIEYYTNGIGGVAGRLNKMEDGNIYWLNATTLGEYKGEPWGGFVGPMIRKDWLDALDIPTPTSTDELFDALLAFRTEDANGDGEANEVISIDYDNFSNGIAQAFGLGTQLVYIDYQTGEAKTPWYEDSIKDYITYMNRLYTEGILDTSGQGSEKKAENKISLINSWWIETWEEPGIMVGEGQAAPYLLGIYLTCDSADPIVNRQNGIQKGSYTFAATSKADPEALAGLLDYLASDEYAALSEFGIEGYTYDVVDGVRVKYTEPSDISEVQIMEKLPALWVNNGILPRAEITNRDVELITCKESGYIMGYPETGFAEKADAIQTIYDHADDYLYAMMDTKANLTPATEEQLEIMADFEADLETYYKELLTKLILGQSSMDNWDKYISDLQSLGLDKMLEITQERYNRANAD